MANRNRQIRIQDILENVMEWDMGEIVRQNARPKYYFKVHQDCPNTMVELWPREGYPDQKVIGFSKVSYPDFFDEETGIAIALAKAASKLVKNGWDNPGEDVPAEEPNETLAILSDWFAPVLTWRLW